MGRPIPVPKREEIVRAHEQGKSLSHIAEEQQIAYWSVRRIWRRYRDRGEVGLIPDYENCGKRGPRSSRLAYRGALRLKRLHPSWGAGYIRVRMVEKWPEVKLPTERTLQRWFRAAGLSPARRGQAPPQQHHRASGVHEVWQMDAKERIPIQGGSQVSWLVATDERSGAALVGQVFPPGGVEPGQPSSGSGGALPGI